MNRLPQRNAMEQGEKTFWSNPPGDDVEVAAPAPLDEFLSSMRGGAAEPKIRVR